MFFLKNIYKNIFSFFLLLITISIFSYNLSSFIYLSKAHARVKPKIEIIKNELRLKQSNFIIGDSRAAASFNPELMSKNYFNISMAGTTPIEGYFILEKLLKKNRIDTLIISYAPFHLVYADSWYDYTLKFRLLNIHNILNVYSYAKLHEDLFFENSGNAFHIDYFLIFRKLFCLDEMKLHKMFANLALYKKRKVDLYDSIIQKKGHVFFGEADSSDGLNREARLKDFLPSITLNYYLNKTFELANQNDIVVFYVNIPFNNSSFFALNSDFIEHYDMYFNKLVKKYPKINFHAQIQNLNNSNFGDNSHFNSDGSNEFTKHFKQKLN